MSKAIWGQDLGRTWVVNVEKDELQGRWLRGLKRQKEQEKKDVRLKKREGDRKREEFRSRSSAVNVGTDRTAQP